MKCRVSIACTLRWGVALVGCILYWAWLTLYGTSFQVQGVYWWTTLSRGRDCEEGRHVVMINPFCKKKKKKCSEQTSSCMYLCNIIVIKFFFWTIVNIVGYVIMVRES